MRFYLDDPLSAEELGALVDLLGGDPTDLVREPVDDPSRDGVIRHLAANPKAMQRPVVVNGQRAIIARPSELALEVLD